MKYLLALTCTCLLSCSTYKSINATNISQTIDRWHQAAAQADYDQYFKLMTDDAVFIGTDATENWQIDQFKQFAKPYFDNGKAWSFTRLERHIYMHNKVVYFDELLDTQMGICRGSGVLKKQNGTFKIAHYVLSIAVPNQHVSSLTQLKLQWDSSYIKQLNQSQNLE